MNGNVTALIYLISCALNGCTADRDYAERMDSAAVFRLAAAHKTAAMAAFALEGVKDALDPEAWKTWKQTKDLALRRDILFDAERGRLLSWMDANGIWYIPLKGILLKDIYPCCGMREMADNDILFDGSRTEDLRAHMEAEGYLIKDSGGVHDGYEKPPVFNFEMHRQLFNFEANGGVFEEYYKDVKDKALPAEGSACGYRFSADDLYIYITAHAFKHFECKGTGLRTLADDYIMRKAGSAELGLGYIAGEFKKLGIEGFAKSLQSAADKLLSPVPEGADPQAEMDSRISSLEEDERRLLGFMVESGVYGTTDHFIEKRLREVDQDEGPLTLWVKIKFFFRWVFPPVKRMDAAVPFTKGRPWLLPIGYIYRMLRAAFARREKIGRELAAYRRVDASRRR